MAGRFISPFVLDDAENGGPLSTTDDVSLYDAVDNAMKCKAARPRAFLDDSLEEEEEPSYASTCPMSCAIGGAVENPTVARVVETKAVDRLEYVESDVNAKPTCSAAKKDCSVSSRQPNDCPTYSEPLASEPPPADVDRASSVGHKEELIPVQPCAKVMPTFGKKKVTLTVSTKAELPAKAKKPMSKGILKGAKGKHTMTADSKKSVEAKVADSAKNNYDETPCCSVASSQSLEDACPDPTTSRGGEVTALDECSSGEDAAGKTHRGAEKKASAGGGHIQKEEESGKAEQKQCSKQKRGKEKQVANKEKLPGAKKLEQERKKVERERKKAKKEEEKIEKELRMIEREFNRLEKENHAKKQDVTLCKSQCEEDEVNEKNEFHILNMEEESQALDCVQPYRADVLCVVDGHPLPTQERSPERAVPDEAAIPGEGAHLISIVTRGEEEEQEGPDPPDEAAVPAEESHVGPNEQVGTKKNMPSRASNAGGQKLSLNPAKKPAQKAAEGFGKQNEMMLKKASSQGRKETAGGPTPTPAWGGASGGPSTEGGGVSGGPSTEGGGVSGGPSTEWGGVSGGPSTEGGGVSDVQATEGGGAFSGQNIVVGGASKNPSTAGGGAGKDEKGGIVAKKLCAGVLKKGFGKSSAGTNKSTTPKCSTICATSAKLSKEKEHVGVKQKTFIAKTGEKKCNPSNASPARKKANTHSHHGPVWVQCDDCKKWRALNDCCDPSGVPEKWVCSMNKDAKFNSCTSLEEHADELRDSQEFIYSPFVLGSVVWAKMCGYPWWPAMIDEDPDEETCFEFVGDDTHPVEFHVVFFGKPVSRAWLRTDGVKPFTGNCNMNDGANVPLKYRQGLQGAVQEALGALDMAIDDRVAKFSFAKRYCPGNKRNRKQFTGEKVKAAPKRLKVAPKTPATPLSEEPKVTPELSDATSEDSEATPDACKEHGIEEQGIDPPSQCSEGED